MAKKQTRRSISVSRGTYERLKAYCETNGISMSQFVETRVGDFLGRLDTAPPPVTTTIEKPLEPPPPRPVVEVVAEPEEANPTKLTADQIFTF